MGDMLEKGNQEVSEQEKQEYVDNVCKHAADLMFNKGYNEVATVCDLVQHGLDEHTANTIVTKLRAQIVEANDKQANKDLLFGFLWTIGGVLLTLVSGGQYLFWGAIVYGVIRIIIGIYRKM